MHNEHTPSPAASSKLLRFIGYTLLACTCPPLFFGFWKLGSLDFGTMPEIGEFTPFNGRMISFSLELSSLIASAGSATFSWQILNDTCLNDYLSGACTDVNIFADTNLMGLSSASPSTPSSNNHATMPLFIFNATAFAYLYLVPGWNDFNYNWPGFRTPVIMDLGSTIQNYPFDSYTTEIYIFAQERESGARVGVEITQTSSRIRGFHAYALRNPAMIPGVIDEIPIVGRTSVVKTYALVIAVGMGIVTILMFIASVRCAIFGRGQRTEVLALPVASLFAISSLRSTLPGAPATFDTLIDYAAILPILGLMAISATLTIGAIVFSDPTKDRETWVTKWCDYIQSAHLFERRPPPPQKEEMEQDV